jgi:two-component system sensor histidine kinase CreC
MTLRRKIFIAFLAIIMVAGAGATYWVQREARDSYAHVVEEILVDIAHLFAEQIQTELKPGQKLSTQASYWAKSFQSFKQREFSARILNVLKVHSSLEVYVTDEKGIVVYSTRNDEEVGRDYSQWRDVALTLKGKYGARATRQDSTDRNTSSYYISAPIYSGQKIIGVVSVIKARASISVILDYFFQQMLAGVLIAATLALIFGGLLFAWITRPVESLRHYALEVAKGNKVALPSMPHKELQQLGDAFEQMRVSLENRKVIERFIQSLTHELKSPLAAMRGSAELTLEPMSESQRNRFLQNIIDESRRAEVVLEEILGIAALESQTELKRIEAVDLIKTIRQAADSLMALFEKNQVAFAVDAKTSLKIEGDSFLLTQAFRNVLQNAVEFSESGGKVQVTVSAEDGQARIQITDDGAGIPDFAKDKIFEKFYSLERPRTGKKGTGLGLSFVQEVILLHKGSVTVQSPSSTLKPGTIVTIHLPLRLR